VFSFRDTVGGGPDLTVEVAFTDSSLDLQGRKPGFPDALARLEEQTGLTFARLNQVHGDDVHVVADAPVAGPLDDVPTADAQVTTLRDVGLMVRVADCVPVVLADPAAGVIGVAHAGRPGMALDIATRTVEAMKGLGATDVVAWIGPQVCGGCYEVPEHMRADVADEVPASYARTTWGTPALDIGAGVRSQLEAAGVRVVDASACTREQDALHSYRRDGAAAGRFAGLVWMHE
jgi:YfiH family protein